MTKEKIDFRRYIKDYESENILRHYCNSNFMFLLEAVAKSLGYYNDTQIEYAKTKKAICDYINKNFQNYNVSKKQLNKMVRPRKNIVSKYAPLYIIAIYNILISNWPKTLHTDICCCKQYDKTYSEFALDNLLTLKEKCSWDNLDDDLIEVFDEYLGIVNYNIPDKLGVEFADNHHKKVIKL